MEQKILVFIFEGLTCNQLDFGRISSKPNREVKSTRGDRTLRVVSCNFVDRWNAWKKEDDSRSNIKQQQNDCV